MPLPDPRIVGLLVAVATGATVALLAWRERSEPGAKPLVALLVGQCWWSTLLIFQLEATTLEAKMLWIRLSWVGIVVIPVAWLLFALEYSGRDQFVRPGYVVALSVVPAVTAVLALTGNYHDLLYVEASLVEQGRHAVISYTVGPWYWLIAGYTYLLGVLGSIPLLGLVTSDASTFRGQSAAIIVGIATPWLLNALFLAETLPTHGIDPTPIGFAISGVAYLGAITRFRLFRTNPAPAQNARRLIFERMQEGAIVVDGNDYVIDMNQEAIDVLRTSAADALGRHAGEVVPEYDRLPEEGAADEHLTLQTDDGTRFYDVNVTRIHNIHGRMVGRVITFHDVGEHLRQQQRLEVMNRVLRHNIRNEITVIHGNAEVLTDGDHGEAAESIQEHAMCIEELAEKARTISEIFGQKDELAEGVSLATMLSDSIAAVNREFPDVTVTCGQIPDVYLAGVLKPVFANVVRNAAEHNTNPDPHVWIHVETEGDQVSVAVADNGPGIDEFERAVLERGMVTSLEHGTGLGLWLIKWGVEIADGQVTFAENDPTGSVVTVEVPVLSRPDDVQHRPDPVTSPR